MSDTALQMRGHVHGTKDARKVAIGSSVGAVIETYDFIGFGTAAALYFGHAFFPGSSPVAGTLLSFATLGVGFAARPLGGILGGHLGDKVGRKPVLVASLIVMGLATFVIGLLPTYASVGLLAPILLVTVRIIQGVAFGAERCRRVDPASDPLYAAGQPDPPSEAGGGAAYCCRHTALGRLGCCAFAGEQGLGNVP